MDTIEAGILKKTITDSAFVTCAIRVLGTRITVDFSHLPPQEPGVYVVYLRDREIPFYVGESRDLRRRLTFLFRCHRSDNPHPCHRRHQDVWDVLPDCETFCEFYGVRWTSTAGWFGRLEAEELLQGQFGTNRKEYYSNFNLLFENDFKSGEILTTDSGVAEGLLPSDKGSTDVECCTTAGCNASCPVWNELITNPAYQGPRGFQVPTMTGRREPLLFSRHHRNGNSVIRVWRASGSLDFTFDENDCRSICRRFNEGIGQGRSFTNSGTSYFNEKSWLNRPLTIITAPFAAPVIRHARQNLGFPI